MLEPVVVRTKTGLVEIAWTSRDLLFEEMTIHVDTARLLATLMAYEETGVDFGQGIRAAVEPPFVRPGVIEPTKGQKRDLTARAMYVEADDLVEAFKAAGTSGHIELTEDQEQRLRTVIDLWANPGRRKTPLMPEVPADIWNLHESLASAEA